MGRKQKQTEIKGTERKELPDLVEAAEALVDAKQALAEATAEAAACEVELRVLCRKYIESGDLTIDTDRHAEAKVPVYLYHVKDGDKLITRKISHGFVEKCGVTKAKRSEVAEAEADANPVN